MRKAARHSPSSGSNMYDTSRRQAVAALRGTFFRNDFSSTTSVSGSIALKCANGPAGSKYVRSIETTIINTFFVSANWRADRTFDVYVMRRHDACISSIIIIIIYNLYCVSVLIEDQPPISRQFTSRHDFVLIVFMYTIIITVMRLWRCRW